MNKQMKFKRLYRKDGMIAEIIQCMNHCYLTTYLPKTSYKETSRYEILGFEEIEMLVKMMKFIEINGVMN